MGSISLLVSADTRPGSQGQRHRVWGLATRFGDGRIASYFGRVEALRREAR